MLSDQALVGLTSLALLDLSKNNLHTIGPASLQPLVSLQVLRITGDHDSDQGVTLLHNIINQPNEVKPPGVRRLWFKSLFDLNSGKMNSLNLLILTAHLIRYVR